MLHVSTYGSKEKSIQGLLKTSHRTRILFKNKTKCIFSDIEIIGNPSRS